MRVFISYGHDVTDFIKNVQAALKAEGYDIWMDHSRLQGGVDWRAEITEGIVNSQAVFLFLSKHSVRPHSVCNDEMMISVACCNQNIRTMLLDKEIKDNIPMMINHIQYFDFTDWREHIDDKEWFDSIIRLLVEELENISKDPYEMQMEALYNALRPDASKTRMLRELKKIYTQRAWLNSKIDHWIENSSNRHLLLLGFPGSGKSSYFSHYFWTSPYSACLMFFEWEKSNYSDVKFAVKNIAYQIASRDASYRRRLIWLLSTNSFSIHMLNGTELFDKLLVEPMVYEIDGQHSPLVVILDGVDEATSDGDNSIARLISEQSSRLPDYVKFIISMRKDSAVLRYYSGARIIELFPNDKLIREDIRTFFTEIFSDAAHETITQHEIAKVADDCNGSFLLASLISDAIISGGVSMMEDKFIANDIFSIYFHWMSRLVSGEEFETKYYNVFSVLVSLKTPITLSLLKMALRWNTLDLNRFLRRFSSFLIEDTDELNNKRLSLFHSSFRDWLSHPDCIADVYSVSIEDGSEILCRSAFEAYKENKLSETEILFLWEYFNTSKRSEYLDYLRHDDGYIKKLIDIAHNNINNKAAYSVASMAIELSRRICNELNIPQASYYLKVEIPFIQACELFISGDHRGSIDLLEKSLGDISLKSEREDYMECLFMLGSSCDLLGERKKSAEHFSMLKDIAEDENNEYYMHRALLGLAWNSHFTNMKRLDEIMSLILKSQSDNDVQNVLSKLVTARALLSQGRLYDALALFSDVLENSKYGIIGFDTIAIRNQMLLIETIVACYDNEQFELGIRYGLQIYEHLSGKETISECYCASWLAMSYIANGQSDEAEVYLCIAERINSDTNSTHSSDWITMHLKSIRAHLFNEVGNVQKALGCHSSVSEMACKCTDPWVQGDAYFEMILIYLLNSINEYDELHRLADGLSAIANSSGLPHLVFKSRLVEALLKPLGNVILLKEIADTIFENSLPSTDMVTAAYLCIKIAQKCSDDRLVEKMKSFVNARIAAIANGNINGAYKSRKIIKRIMMEVMQ